MNKSIFKYLMGAVLAVLLLAGCAGKKAPEVTKFPKKLPVGVQLYSVRTDLEADFYGTLKQIREMGYAGVEFYGEYYGNSVAQVKRWCTELGLIPFSNHVPFQQDLYSSSIETVAEIGHAVRISQTSPVNIDEIVVEADHKRISFDRPDTVNVFRTLEYVISNVYGHSVGKRKMEFEIGFPGHGIHTWILRPEDIGF